MLRNDRLEKRGQRQELVVLLHGFSVGSSKMRDVADLVRERMPNADILAPDMPIRRIFARTKSVDIVAALLSRIDAICASHQYKRIWIVGYSCGAVLARKLFLAAWNAAPDVYSGDRPKDWAPALRRLVFFAGINTGWTITGAVDWWTSTVWRAGEVVGDMLFFGRLSILDFRQGSPFLTETRLQWLKLMRDLGPWRRVVLVQTLGTVDDVVSPESTVDWALDACSTSNFYPLTMEHTGHLDSVNFASNPVGADRRRVAALALSRSRATLRRRTLQPDDLVETLALKPDPSVKDVVFVIHGIRDRGYWTQKIAVRIRALSRQAGRVPFQTVAGHYGYFAMLPFIMRSERAGKVRWFSDLYVSTVARFPNASLHYVGHSNGTYLLARALGDCPSMQFGRVVFAGSVVRSDYDWASLLRWGRVERVMNYVAERDWVVAIFPRGLEPLRRFDLGGAGWSGFLDGSAPTPGVTQLRYIKGAHSAGIAETQWDEISNFIVAGATPPWSTNPDFVAGQWKYLRIGTAVRWLPLLGCFAALMAVLAFLVSFGLDLLGGGTAALILVVLALFLALRIVFFRL